MNVNQGMVNRGSYVAIAGALAILSVYGFELWLGKPVASEVVSAWSVLVTTVTGVLVSKYGWEKSGANGGPA